MFHRFALVLLLLVAAVPAVARTSASAVRVAAHPDGVTRFVLDLSGGMDFHIRLEANPDRLIVENDGITWATDPVLARPTGVVKGLHYEEQRGARLVLDLRQPAEVKQAFVLSPREGQGWRFVLDLRQTTRQAFLAAAGAGGRDGGPPAAKAAPRPEVSQSPVTLPPPPSPQTAQTPPVTADPQSAPPSIIIVSPQAETPPTTDTVQVDPPSPPPSSPSPPANQPPVPEPRPSEGRYAGNGSPMVSAPIPPPAPRPAPPPAPAVTPDPPTAATPPPAPVPLLEPKRGDGKPVIVIDPGHGGVDPGATSISGIHEKVITLSVAGELKAQLERTGRYHVYLTRDRDVFIRLHDRVAVARQYNADLFISLHADVVKDTQIRGLSVYTLSQTASDAESQALADKENKADLIAGIDLSHESADVANILIDLAQRETLNRSAAFAGEIVGELGRVTPLLSNTHRFAGFAVLKAPDVPAVLIEMGYLSNESEEKSLRTTEYRTRLSRAIAKAVDRYFAADNRGRH